MNALTLWYARQSARDQRIVVIAASVAGALLVLWLALLPQQAVGRARQRVADQQQLLEYMRQVGPTLAAAAPGAAVQPIGESFVVFIDRTAREFGLAQSLTGTPAAGNGAFRVTFEAVDFNLMLTWLHQLSTRYAVQVEGASVNSTGAPGKVNASVQLRPPG